MSGKNSSPTQIKSACNWQEVIYKGRWKWNSQKITYVAIEPDNTNYIEKLKSDTASNPKRPVDCRRWE